MSRPPRLWRRPCSSGTGPQGTGARERWRRTCSATWRRSVGGWSRRPVRSGAFSSRRSRNCWSAKAFGSPIPRCTGSRASTAGSAEASARRCGWRSASLASWPRWTSGVWGWCPTPRRGASGWPGRWWSSWPTAATSTCTSRSRRSCPMCWAAWRTPGSGSAGCPAGWSLDNLKAAIDKADRYEPISQRVFEEYARHRGFVIDPDPLPGSPGQAGRGAGGSLCAGTLLPRRGLDRPGARPARGRALVRPDRRDARPRHDPPAAAGRVRERGAGPAPAVRGRALRHAHWGKYKVHPDHHVSFQRALYSVPHAFLGRTVWVRGDTKLVRIYADGTLIKTHPRRPPGARSTDYDDYPKELTSYALRDPQRMIRQAERHGTHLGCVHGRAPLRDRALGQASARPRSSCAWAPSTAGIASIWPAAEPSRSVSSTSTASSPSCSRTSTDSRLPQESRAPQPVIPIQLRFQRPAGSFTHPST